MGHDAREPKAARGAAARGRRHQSSSDLELQTTWACTVFFVRRWRRRRRIMVASAALFCHPTLAKIACQDYVRFSFIEGFICDSHLKILEELDDRSPCSKLGSKSGVGGRQK